MSPLSMQDFHFGLCPLHLTWRTFTVNDVICQLKSYRQKCWIDTGSYSEALTEYCKLQLGIELFA